MKIVMLDGVSVILKLLTPSYPVGVAAGVSVALAVCVVAAGGFVAALPPQPASAETASAADKAQANALNRVLFLFIKYLLK